MAKLSEVAKEYEAPTTHNITELKSVSVDIDVSEVVRTKKDGEEFTLNVVNVDDVEYRVPTTVISQLKTMLEEKPDMKSFKVVKKGEGLKTEYTVVPQ